MEICLLIDRDKNQDFRNTLKSLKDSEVLHEASIVFESKSREKYFYVLSGTEQDFTYLKLMLGNDAWLR